MSAYSSQDLTIHDPQKVWIIDDYLQWSNLAYLAVSRVEYMRQLERVVCPPEESSEVMPTVPATEQQLHKTIAKKLVAYKHQDQAKGLRFNLKVDHILHLKITTVPPAILGSSGLTSLRISGSSPLTVWTMPKGIPVTT